MTSSLAPTLEHQPPSPFDVKKDILVRHNRVSLNPEFDKYSSFTFPRLSYAHLVKAGCKEVIASSITIEGQMIGLCICLAQPNQVIELLSFYMKKEYRGQGYGKGLMKSIIHMCQSSGNQELQLTYRTFWADNITWEFLLRSTGWVMQSTDTSYVHVPNLLELKSLNFINYSRAPQGSKFIELDKKGLHQLRHWVDLVGIEDIPGDVHPMKQLTQIYKECSLLLIIDSNIAGWILFDCIDQETLQVSALHVRPEYSKQYKRLGLYLIAESIRRNTNPYQVYFGIRKHNNYMLRFLDRIIPEHHQRFEKKKATLLLV